MTNINVYLTKIENSDVVEHEKFAVDMNNSQELLDEFMYIGKNLAVEGFSIEEWIKGFSVDLNVNINFYDSQQVNYAIKQSKYTQALVLSILMIQNEEVYMYGVLYHEQYREFNTEHHNLDYRNEKCKHELSELQKFEVFAKESLELIVKEHVTQEFCDRMNEIYYKIKPHCRKFLLFEERIARIGRWYLGNVKKCDWCNNCISTVKFECMCLVCFSCINAYQGNDCMNCTKAFSENWKSELNRIKSTFT